MHKEEAWQIGDTVCLRTRKGLIFGRLEGVDGWDVLRASTRWRVKWHDGATTILEACAFLEIDEEAAGIALTL